MILKTPKGFRDFLPSEALRRKLVLEKIVSVLQKFGFDPLETPTLEYAQNLKGKYGEEEKLIYEFTTPGEDRVALKYDQTVPLARVVAQYGPSGKQALPLPFKRYQIQDAYRGENTQKGRYRQFLQCDADIVGIKSFLADCEILALVCEIYQNLKLDIVIKVNDRSLFEGIDNKYLTSIDKLEKIGKEKVLLELQNRGLAKEQAKALLERFKNFLPTENLNQIINLYLKMGYSKDSIEFDPTLVRGLDYYTGLILEVVVKESPYSPALGGGGRYDNLIAKFSGNSIPSVGFALGFDRTVEALQEANLLDTAITLTKVLVSIFSSMQFDQSLDLATKLRSKGIPTELYLDPSAKLEKQIKYANQKNIPYVVIIGPIEEAQNRLICKDLRNGTQQSLTIDELYQKLSSYKM